MRQRSDQETFIHVNRYVDVSEPKTCKITIPKKKKAILQKEIPKLSRISFIMASSDITIELFPLQILKRVSVKV